jgi:hypothetical protein
MMTQYPEPLDVRQDSRRLATPDLAFLDSAALPL